MPSLTIKGISDELLEDLRAAAQQNRRSLNSEILVRLEQSVGRRPMSAEEFIARARAIRELMKDVPPLTDEFIRQARDEGRP